MALVFSEGGFEQQNVYKYRFEAELYCKTLNRRNYVIFIEFFGFSIAINKVILKFKFIFHGLWYFLYKYIKLTREKVEL